MVLDEVSSMDEPPTIIPHDETIDSIIDDSIKNGPIIDDSIINLILNEHSTFEDFPQSAGLHVGTDDEGFSEEDSRDSNRVTSSTSPPPCAPACEGEEESRTFPDIDLVLSKILNRDCSSPLEEKCLRPPPNCPRARPPLRECQVVLHRLDQDLLLRSSVVVSHQPRKTIKEVTKRVKEEPQKAEYETMKPRKLLLDLIMVKEENVKKKKEGKRSVGRPRKKSKGESVSSNENCNEIEREISDAVLNAPPPNKKRSKGSIKRNRKQQEDEIMAVECRFGRIKRNSRTKRDKTFAIDCQWCGTPTPECYLRSHVKCRHAAAQKKISGRFK